MKKSLILSLAIAVTPFVLSGSANATEMQAGSALDQLSAVDIGGGNVWSACDYSGGYSTQNACVDMLDGNPCVQSGSCWYKCTRTSYFSNYNFTAIYGSQAACDAAAAQSASNVQCYNLRAHCYYLGQQTGISAQDGLYNYHQAVQDDIGHEVVTPTNNGTVSSCGNGMHKTNDNCCCVFDATPNIIVSDAQMKAEDAAVAAQSYIDGKDLAY